MMLQSTTDLEARRLRKGTGKEAKLVFLARALMENRNGLLVDSVVSEASGTRRSGSTLRGAPR